MTTLPDIDPPAADPHRPGRPLPPGSCDAHAHIFGPADRYPYQPERDYTPHDASRQDYARLLHTLGMSRAVLVQPSVYGTDNRLLADALAQSAADPLGIEWRGVAVLDETVPQDELERLHGLGVRGARLNLLNRGGGIGFDNVARLADRLAPLGWHLQFLVDISTFEDFAGRLARLPVTTVVDHMGHFPAGLGPQCPAFRSLLALMREGRTWVKVSGPNRISSHPQAPFPDAEALARALAAHMPDRLVFGTDWPHVRLPTPMPDDGDLVDEFLRWIDHDEDLMRRILVENPARLYGF